MKNITKHISLYWKCQAAGWGLLTLINLFFIILYKIPGSHTERRMAVFSGTGILVSHLMKTLIKKLNILDKSIKQQIISATLFTILFGALSGIVTVGLDKYFKILREWDRQLSAFKLMLNYAFNFILILCVWSCIYLLYHFIKHIRKEELQKREAQKNFLELEEKALRAQMNPHFIFNSLNSIKSLIQQDEKEKSVTYLTTFSKLIRTLLNNADKKEISLYDEIETCKLYLQLEAMRFDTKFSYAVNIDENIDLKSVQVPALIIQPFIENAIWHGIVPRNSGGHVSLNVLRKDGTIEVVIDDDGIGREASQQNKSASGLAHQSRGVNLTQSRLELDNLLQQRQAKLEIIDKKDQQGAATGTKIIITLKEEA